MMTRRMTYGLIALVVLGLALGGAVWARAAQGPEITLDAIGSGAQLNHGATTLTNAVGQAIVGSDRQGATTLCAGIWCEDATTYTVFIPVVLRNVP